MIKFGYLTTILVFMSACGLSTLPANADSFKLDYGNLSASGQQITITRLPIFRDGAGPLYRDIVIEFQLDKKNRLKVVSGYPKTTKSPGVLSANVVAGRYILNQDSDVFDLVGPGVGPGGRSLWSLVGANNTLDMTFYGGAVDGHPYQERLNNAGIVSSPYTFGVSSNPGTLGMGYGNGCLVAIHMIGNQIKLDSYSSNNCGADFENPTRSNTLLVCENPDCD
jgi:hypothetical protein